MSSVGKILPARKPSESGELVDYKDRNSVMIATAGLYDQTGFGSGTTTNPSAIIAFGDHDLTVLLRKKERKAGIN